jgi:replicative DNA helicase
MAGGDVLAAKQRGLPYSEEAERAVLGGLLLDPERLGALRARLTPEDFYLERHQAIYRAMLAVAGAGSTPDLVTLQAQMELDQTWDASGAIGYLSVLDLGLPDLDRLAEYAGIVRERALRRALIRVASETVREAVTSKQPLPDLLGKLGSAAAQLLAGAVPARWSQAGAAVDEILEVVATGRAEALQGLKTGFPDWDRFGPVLLPGNLYILAGRPGMGKSALALDLVRHLTLRSGLPVGVFSLEMDERELALRLASAEADVATRYLRAGHCSENHWRALWGAARRILAAPLWIDDTKSLSLEELEARARRLKAEHPGLAVLVVDYLNLLGVNNQRSKREEQVALISRRLKTAVAGDLGVAVVALAQLNRDNSRRSDPRPTLSDLRESGAIEQDADQVVFVHRPEYYEPGNDELRGLAELIVAKNRQGVTGTADLLWVPEVTSFRNRVPPPDSAPATGDPF